MRRSVIVKREKDVAYAEVESDGSRTVRCRKPDTGASSAEKTGCSTDSARSRKVHGRVMYSERNASVAVMEVRNVLTWQEHLTAK